MSANLEAKFDLYLRLLPSTQDTNGFVQYHECDSLLFSGLLGAVPGTNVNLTAAQNPTELTWHRRPLNYPECCPEGAASTISKDMMIGICVFAYANRRLDIAEGVIKYALSHWLVMGKATDLKTKLSRCVISPGLLATFAEISYRLGGPNRWWLRYLPQYESPSVTDYQAHLSALHVILRHKLTGKISSSNLELMKMHARRQPQNPLFHIAAGDTESAEAALSSEKIWPSTRLPTSLDRSEPWVIQRDQGHDWEPNIDAPLRWHSGGDYLFCYALLKGLIK